MSKIKTYSDRGKISDLHKKHEEEPLFPSDIRLQKLINYAMTYRDQALFDSLGFIANENNNPTIAKYRLQAIVDGIKAKKSVDQNFVKELERCFSFSSYELDHKIKMQVRKIANASKCLFKRINT